MLFLLLPALARSPCELPSAPGILLPDMGRRSVLVVEDDASTSDLVRSVLSAERFEVSVASSVFQARGLLARRKPDLVILDRNLPDQDGIEFLKELRASPEGRDLPVLFLTGRRSVTEKVLGLKLGGDDYLAKPFNPEELVARVEALLRRLDSRETPSMLVQEPLRLNPSDRLATLSGRKLDLTNKEFDLLRAFLERPGRLLTRNFLLAHVWGYDAEVEIDSKAVDMVLVGLRRKIGECGDWIESVKGFGYRFTPREAP